MRYPVTVAVPAVAGAAQVRPTPEARFGLAASPCGADGGTGAGVGDGVGEGVGVGVGVELGEAVGVGVGGGATNPRFGRITIPRRSSTTTMSAQSSPVT